MILPKCLQLLYGMESVSASPITSYKHGFEVVSKDLIVRMKMIDKFTLLQY